jgi:uncharacterized protein YndB with AHSA1/START domain
MASPVHIEESVQIAKPPNEVWDAIADYGFDAQWRKGLTDMTPDPPGPAAAGTKVHEVVHSSGRDYIADTIVTAFEPGVSYRFEGSGSIGGLTGARSVRPADDGAASVFTYEINLTPTGAMRLLRPILGATVRSNLKKDLQKLKSLLEAA